MTSQEQLQEEVRNIALALEAVAQGRYNFYTCEIADDDTDIDEAECNDDNYESDFDGGFARYFEDALDIEYRVDSRLHYRSAIITVAVGGPSIYVDTYKGEVVGLWWSDKATAYIWHTTANAIDDACEEYYNAARGCY